MEEKILEIIEKHGDSFNDPDYEKNIARKTSLLFTAFISFLNRQCEPVFGSADQWHLYAADGTALLCNLTAEELFRYWLKNVYGK